MSYIITAAEFDDSVKSYVETKFARRRYLEDPKMSQGYQFLTKTNWSELTVNDLESYHSTIQDRDNYDYVLDCLVYPVVTIINHYSEDSDLRDLKNSKMLISEEIVLWYENDFHSDFISTYYRCLEMCINYYFITGNMNVRDRIWSVLTKIVSYRPLLHQHIIYPFFKGSRFSNIFRVNHHKLILPFWVINDVIRGGNNLDFNMFQTFVEEHTEFTKYDGGDDVKITLSRSIEDILDKDGKFDHLTFIRFLVSKGGDVNTLGVLEKCLKFNSIEYISTMIELGMDIREITNKNPEPYKIFSIAIKKTKPEVFQYLIDNGFNIHFPFKRLNSVSNNLYDNINIAINHDTDIMSILNSQLIS